MALTADRTTPARDGIAHVFDVAAATRIYAGAMVALNAAGAAVPATATAGLTVVGRAEEQVDNTAGDAGDQTVRVNAGVFRWTNSAGADEITDAHVGRVCYAVDDETVAATSNGGARSPAGRVVDVDDLGVWVDQGPRVAAPAVEGPFTKTLTGISSPLAANTTASDTFVVSGVLSTDRVLGVAVTGTRDGAVHDVRVSDDDQITVRTVNASGSSLTFATAPVVTFDVRRS